jgi:hypothetical protein
MATTSPSSAPQASSAVDSFVAIDGGYILNAHQSARRYNGDPDGPRPSFGTAQLDRALPPSDRGYARQRSTRVRMATREGCDLDGCDLDGCDLDVGSPGPEVRVRPRSPLPPRATESLLDTDAAPTWR